MPPEDPIHSVRLSDALRVAAHGRGGDIPWRVDGSQGLRLEDVEAIMAIPDDAEFVRAAYEGVLGRRADAGGAAFRLGALSAGMERGELLLDLAESPEGRVRKGADGIRAALRAHRLGSFLSVGGSVIDREHLAESARVDQVWPLLWVDAVREVIPGVLLDSADADAFAMSIAGGVPPGDAVAAAWKAALAGMSLPARIVGRLRMRFAWHRTWARVNSRFRENVAFYVSVGQLLDGPGGRD